MKTRSVQAIIEVLAEAKSRYLVVGGLAVVAHGYVRYTADVDLVVALDPANVQSTMAALSGLGYRPRIPVGMADFGNKALREQWVREKGMVVFQLFSDEHMETPIDVFVTMPFDFEVQWSRADWRPLLGEAKAPVVALDELLAMKVAVAREQDLIDISKLRKIHDLR